MTIQCSSTNAKYSKWLTAAKSLPHNAFIQAQGLDENYIFHSADGLPSLIPSTSEQLLMKRNVIPIQGRLTYAKSLLNTQHAWLEPSHHNAIASGKPRVSMKRRSWFMLNHFKHTQNCWVLPSPRHKRFWQAQFPKLGIFETFVGKNYFCLKRKLFQNVILLRDTLRNVNFVITWYVCRTQRHFNCAII